MPGTIQRRQVKLRGLERMLTMADGVSMKIVHSMLLVGDVDTLLRFLPVALMKTFNMHPRMRALQVKKEDFMAEIQDTVSLDDISTKDLLRIRQFTRSESTEGASTTGNSMLNKNATLVSIARLMLFSDHYMSDGRSGMSVLNCALEQVAVLAEQGDLVEDKPVQEFPLRPSFYEMWFSKHFLFKELLKGVMNLFGEAIYRSEMKKFQPLLPARDDQHDFEVPPLTNPTSALFLEGDPDCMRKTLVKCKEEGVTFGGALVAAITLAFYYAAKKQPGFEPGKSFKVAADIDYNIRQRMPCPAEEDQVGAHIAFTDLGWLVNEGFNVETTRFWDLARRAKREIDGNLLNTRTMAAMTIILDQKLNSQMKPSLAKSVNIRHSQTSNANISNVGRYPYAKEHPLTSRDGDQSFLAVKNLHVYNPIPHLGPSAVFFVSSVESFCFFMGYKCADGAAKSLFTAWVDICENVGSIGSDDSLVNVLKRRNM
ncbi:hypothetical protein PI124_g4548 [Phytophthora idaei]|nr:hypothetical protein PI125_g3200 [Phytophthora idaei]KAG3167614.1 hypothetical protein PI126_g3725 [Phytophthora idaei]KAG3250802.1 hypothetical protein PI124_g4548 [Phytophthora idaei]